MTFVLFVYIYIVYRSNRSYTVCTPYIWRILRMLHARNVGMLYFVIGMYVQYEYWICRMCGVYFIYDAYLHISYYICGTCIVYGFPIYMRYVYCICDIPYTCIYMLYAYWYVISNISIPYTCIYMQYVYWYVISNIPATYIHQLWCGLYIWYISRMLDMWWLQWVGCLKIYVSLQNIGLFCRSLLQKRPIFLSILLVVATPYVYTPIVVRALCMIHISIWHCCPASYQAYKSSHTMWLNEPRTRYFNEIWVTNSSCYIYTYLEMTCKKYG